MATSESDAHGAGADIEVGPVTSRGVIEISQSRRDRRESMMAVYYTPEEAKRHAERILNAVGRLDSEDDQ